MITFWDYLSRGKP